jgi:Ca2+-binding RTX toxin-like protein
MADPRDDDRLEADLALLVDGQLDSEQAGDDTVTGGGKNDPLSGGDGDDRVVGSPGDDTMTGGNGNDVLVWNNGDGNDTMDGDAGNDEIEVNGAANAGDDFRITPGANGRTRFDRVNLGLFNLNTLAERMTVSGLGGDDSIAGAPGLAGRILLTLNGNTGLDTITGGDGADRVSGGEAADVLDGGAGDDVLEWNDGDGSDVATGGDGADLTRVNGSVTQGDAFEVAPNGAGIRFQRTNLVPFTIDLDTERIEMNTLAGDDTIAVKPGLAGRLGVLADGGSGNDRIEARNASADSIEGGSGADSAVVDLADTTANVETIDRPARSRAHRPQGAGRAPQRQARGQRLGELPGRRGVALHRRGATEHRQGREVQRHQGAARPGQPQVPGRPGRDGQGQGEAAGQGRIPGQARQARPPGRGRLEGERRRQGERPQPDGPHSARLGK